MPTGKLFTNISVAVVVLGTLIATFGLVRALTSGGPLDMVINNLELWITGVGYRLVIITLAAAGVSYLVHKK